MQDITYDESYHFRSIGKDLNHAQRLSELFAVAYREISRSFCLVRGLRVQPLIILHPQL